MITLVSLAVNLRVPYTNLDKDATVCPGPVHTVCPGSSAPPEKIFNIFASENEVYTIY